MPTALIVEDHKDISLIFRTTLENINFEVEVAANGQSALDILEQFVPDLIILDMNLPQVSGHYVYKQIRSDSRLDETIVIICTANNVLANVMAEEIFAQDKILLKPVGPSDLTAVIKSL